MPWNDKVFNTGDWGCGSVAKLYGDEFDINKFQMVLEKQIEVEFVPEVEAKDAVEEVAHWEREVLQIED